MDIDKLMKLDLSYPGISFGYHSWSLGIYLQILEDFISSAGDQYRVRARKDLDERRSVLPDEVYMQELSYIDEAADEHIPSYARMSAIVLVWGIFESTVSDIARYIARKDSVTLKFRDIRADGFVTQISRYFGDVLGIQLPWTESQVNSVRSLKAIRDAVAHRNGQFIDAPRERKRTIQEMVKQVTGVHVSGSQLMVAGAYVVSSTTLVFSMIESLNAVVSSRYDGPTV